MPVINPLDSLPAPLFAEKAARFDWVEMRLAENFMHDTKAAMPAGLVVACIMAAVLYNSVPFFLLMGWLATCNTVILLRIWVVVQYERHMRQVSGAELRAFFDKYAVLWPLSGTVWGLSVALFLSRATAFEQLTCITLLIGVCCVSVYISGSRLRSYLAFVYAFCGTALVIFLYSMFVTKAVPQKA